MIQCRKKFPIGLVSLSHFPVAMEWEFGWHRERQHPKDWRKDELISRIAVNKAVAFENLKCLSIGELS